MATRKHQQHSDARPQRVRLTMHLTLEAYEAIRKLQFEHRTRTGRAIAIWELLDKAVRAYAREEGIQIKERS